MGFRDIGKSEATRVQPWHQLSGLDEFADLTQDLAVVASTFAGQKRQQRKHSRIGCRFERQRGKRVCSPSERADDVTEAADRTEGSVKAGAADRIVDDVEAFAPA